MQYDDSDWLSWKETIATLIAIPIIILGTITLEEAFLSVVSLLVVIRVLGMITADVFFPKENVKD